MVRIRGWANRANQAADRHRLLTILVVVVLVSAPGYWRQEQTVNKAQDATVQVGHATDRVEVVAAQAKVAADQAREAAEEAKRAIAQAQDAIAQIVAQRTESRIKLCEKDQRFAVAHNLFIQATANGFAGFVFNLGELSKRPDDPEQNAAVDAEVKRQSDLFTASVNKARVAVPDCTPEGIARSYDGETP
jgi:NACalpha-BTF3-like transcription factor